MLQRSDPTTASLDKASDGETSSTGGGTTNNTGVPHADRLMKIFAYFKQTSQSWPQQQP
jgi:hypothetical protein